MDWEESKRLKRFEQQLGQRLGRSEQRYLQRGHRRNWLRVSMYAIWYVLVAVATVSTTYQWFF